MSESRIRQCRVEELFDDEHSEELFAEYAEACLMSGAVPQREIYLAMENSGVLQCFGAYVAEELVGFASVLTAVMPHNGLRLATVESIFVAKPHRSSGAGDLLLDAAENYAVGEQCAALLYTPRIDSALAKILARRSGCRATHTVYTMWL